MLIRVVLTIVVLLYGLVTIKQTVYAAEQKTQQANEQLSKIKKSIEQQKSALQHLNKSNAELEQALRQDDLTIANIVQKINQTTKTLNATQQELKQLTKNKQQLTQAKQQQESLLAKQLRAAYSTGKHDYLKLMLNQENTSKVQRTISYYQYLNKARINTIEDFQSTIAQLLEVTEQQQQKAQQLTQLNNQQTKDKQALQANQQKRRQTITQLKKQIASDQQKLAHLESQEANLLATLKRLEQLAKRSLNLVGLSKLKGKLSWPVKGRKLYRFGSKKQGYLNWKGALFSAPVGRQVHSVYNGKVLFADWLKGYGLVTVIDHGDGYMSLYGHNQTLLKKVGDQVEKGEPIALVGQSGGNERSGLYFEIRHQGKAVNPRIWCR